VLIRSKKNLIIFSIVLLLISWGIYAWTHLGTWLVAADRPQPAEVIVCLSGPERIRKSAELFHQGLAPLIILTAARDKRPLAEQGVPESRVILASGPTTTYQEAMTVAPILKGLHCRSALIVSDPFHLRRVRWTFGHVLNHASGKLYFVASDLPWEGRGWWRNKKEKLYVYSELSKIGYYRLAHGLLGVAEEPPWIIDLKRRYESWLKRMVA
jgi:uncharacterized SAM-binding protein YcdF (DUF218 family)